VPPTLQHPPGCYAHFNDYSCGNLRSEWVFVFGSCRDFFGEACLKRPPELAPLPPRPAPSIMGLPSILGGPPAIGSSNAVVAAGSGPGGPGAGGPGYYPGAGRGGPGRGGPGGGRGPGSAAAIWGGGCNCGDR